MNRTRIVYAALALCMALAVGTATAGKYNQKHLVGTWEFDMVKMYTEIMKQSGQEMPPGMSIEQMLGDSYMRLTFNDDGSYLFESKTQMGENSDKGTWEVTETTDDGMNVKTVNEAGEEQMVAVTFKDKDNFDATMTGGESQVTMSASRAKKADTEKEKKSE